MEDNGISRQHPHERRCFQHFALIYIDREGKLCHETSPSISNSIKTILSPQVTRCFWKAVAESKERGFSAPGLPGNQPPFLPTSSLAPPTPGPAKPGASLRRRRETWTEGHTLAIQTATIPVNEKRLLRQYYEKVFQNLQQTNCRVLAKVWVKLVEPRKQFHFPYNGRKIVEGKTIQFSPKETQPSWWPPGVSHREPDHLPKAERIALLIHILCELHTSHGITAQKLKDAGRHIQQSISPIERLQLLDELYRVKEEEEKFLDRVTDGNTKVSISRANLPDSTVVGDRGHHQSLERTWIAQTSEHEPPIQNTSICFQTAQDMIPLNLPVDPCAITDIHHEEDLSIEPNSSPSPVLLQGLKRSFSSVEDAGVPTRPSTAEICSSSFVAFHPLSLVTYEDFPLDLTIWLEPACEIGHVIDLGRWERLFFDLLTDNESH
ncbi:hypothetical protein N7476_004977 [Penicillium atrosanguineum]|uniref:Subtelomeric hrmA-associated cluster protein AFUB-079030/YDR124W-like helical bundle domain-containing protein n=1 Tax=Penicillium atrosanguineum TaxID=1132637 RepID=A0A9W9PZ08_9EURO|nr:hypothetical protein N7526_010871 [Penicillium atrosanguineum]KAJ5318557.1 hypothetical protein N7476_004977 [Penicillium atrosanguineum]